MLAIKINAETREGTGKSVTRKLRAGGKVPAVLYGEGKTGVNLVLSLDEVDRVLGNPHARSSILTLVLAGEKGAEERNVLIKEIQRHPVRDHVFHLDFLEVSMDREVSIKVPVELTGTAEGIKMGGILQWVVRELPVLCLPSNIPSEIKLDVTALNIGDSIHVKDVAPPAGVRIPYNTNFTILSIVGAAAEEVPVAAAAVPAEGEAAAEPEKAEPEVIGKGKKEKEEEE